MEKKLGGSNCSRCNVANKLQKPSKSVSFAVYIFPKKVIQLKSNLMFSLFMEQELWDAYLGVFWHLDTDWNTVGGMHASPRWQRLPGLGAKNHWTGVPSLDLKGKQIFWRAGDLVAIQHGKRWGKDYTATYIKVDGNVLVRNDQLLYGVNNMLKTIYG